MPKATRAKMEGRETVETTAILGAKARATNQVKAPVLENAKSDTLSLIIMEHVHPGAEFYRDDAPAYSGFTNHESKKRGIMKCDPDAISTDGLESFWLALKLSYISRHGSPIESSATRLLISRMGRPAHISH